MGNYAWSPSPRPSVLTCAACGSSSATRARALATENELSRELPDLDAGALPPFGAPAPPLALVDRRVLSCNWVLANGGDHRHSLRVSPLEIVRLSHARVVDIAEG